MLFVYSFWRYVPGEGMQPAFILENYVKFLGDRYCLKVLYGTLFLGFQVTLLSLMLGFPVAIMLSRARPTVRGLLYVLVLAPLLTSAVVRTFGWMILLGDKGFVNTCIIAMGLVENPIKFMYTHRATVIGLTEVLMPFMIFSLESVLHNIDRSLYEAARNLGSNVIRIFLTITVPLSVPGIAAGSILVFSLAISAYVTPSLMGGPPNPVMSTMIYDQAFDLMNWPFGSAISFSLLMIILVILYVYMKVLRLGKLAEILR
jgi:putative spermidine/putrescine transport system permease protein